MTQGEHAHAGEEWMTATLLIRETYRDKEGENKKSRKRGKKQENRTQGVQNYKASSLCHKAEPGTL